MHARCEAGEKLEIKSKAYLSLFLNYQGSEIIDKDCLSNLQYIVDETGAKIVLISTWKQFLDDKILGALSDDDKERFLYYRELLGTVFKDNLSIIDMTEDYFSNKNEIISEISLSDLETLDIDDHSAWRSIEISWWLEKNKSKNIESFVIIDDFNCKYSEIYPNNWVGTYWFGKGLRKEDVRKAINILNKDFEI